MRNTLLPLETVVKSISLEMWDCFRIAPVCRFELNALDDSYSFRVDVAPFDGLTHQVARFPITYFDLELRLDDLMEKIHPHLLDVATRAGWRPATCTEEELMHD